VQRATEIISLVETEIGKLSLKREPRGLYDPIVYSMQNGGKRIRPLLTILACELFDKKQLPQAMDIALAFEIFHNFTLLHDDLMDQAPIRRGKPSVHVKWNASTAVLSGDAMLVEAFKMIHKTKTEKSAQIIELFAQTAQEVCEGQQYDMEFEKRPDVSEMEYLDMIKLKTSVLLGACLKAGAWAGGASDTYAAMLYDYGINLGMAFQLQDDWLDTFGDEKIFGKKTGGDIVSAKKTYLLIKAIEEMGTKKSTLLFTLNDKTLDEEQKIETVKSIYIKYKTDQMARIKMEEYVRKANEILKKLAQTGKSTNDLEQLGEYLLNRDK
jgi:geranylgeranyl diphosphate synthase, type II